MREYVVTVYDPLIWDTGLWSELTESGLQDNFIPSRPIEVINERPLNGFCAHFKLSEQEALEIKQDPRIKDVELLPELRQDIKCKPFGTQYAQYDRSRSTTATMKNWGLYRSISKTNNFGTSLSVLGDYTSNLDGTGIDLIVVDTGVAQNHPEFAVNKDGTGGSRVRDCDWHALAVQYGISGVNTAAACSGYLGDGDGHGSNCASIAAGNTCGWATGADIYSIRIFAGVDIVTGIELGSAVASTTSIFDLVTAFHLRKIANTPPGAPVRPTVCTNSWGYSGLDFSNMSHTNYRGTQYTVTNRTASYGQVTDAWPIRVTSIDADVTNCANAGVILIGAAGNSSYKMDVPGGLDYNNYWHDSATNSDYYYHRGSSPGSADGMICVGAIDSLQTTSNERKATFSNTGPRIDVFAPGAVIMGAYANASYYAAAVVDPRSPPTAPHYLNKISGTSQACPQAAGLLACVAQARPTITPAQARAFLIEHSLKNVLTQSGTSGYTNYTDLQTAPNRYMYMPFNSPVRGVLQTA